MKNFYVATTLFTVNYFRYENSLVLKFYPRAFCIQKKKSVISVCFQKRINSPNVKYVI